jgi:hypothetical protein
MVNRHFILFALAFAAALSGVAKTFDVDISTGRPAASNEAYYHGETIEFRAVRGKSVVTNIEYAAIYYQTNGMGNVWWRTDGLTFHPTNDVGAASYRFFMEGRDDLGRDWHANGLLRLLPSPGFAPNTLQLPVAMLDFAAVEVLNPPWTDPDYSTSNAALVETIEATAPAPGNYAAVSNRAMNAASRADVEAGWWSGWKILRTYNGETANVTSQVQVPLYDSEEGIWLVGVISGDGRYGYDSPVTDTDYVAELTWNCGNGAVYTATRRRVAAPVPTKPEDIGAASPGTVSNVVTKAYVEGLGISSEETDPTIGLTNGTIYVKGSTITPLTQYSETDPTVPAWAKSETQPLPPDYSTVSNRAMTALQSYTESDPTIKSWAKAETKPTYTAEEVGATTAADVYRLVAGTNVVLVVTNYNSATHAASMKLQHLDPESGQYVTYWDEMRQHGITYTNGMNYTDAAIAERAAPRAWSGTTSGLGSEAPAGVTWISTPETVIAGGFEYEKVVTSAGAVWVLTSNGMSTGATSNSFFRVAASDGTELFSIEKTDSYIIGVNADGITRSGNTVTIPINVVAAEHPYIRCTKNLVNPTWVKEDEGGFDCAWATVSWSGTTGAYVATVTTAEPQAFFYFEYMVEGQVKIKNSAKTEMSGGILFNGTTYLPTVNGNKLEFVAQ